MNNHTEIARDLLGKNFPVTVADTQNWTPLHCVCFSGNKELFVSVLPQHTFLIGDYRWPQRECKCSR